MIVVDTNIIAYFWIPGEHTEATEQLFQFDRDWNVPLLWRSEFRNVLVSYLRAQWLTLNVAEQIINRAEQALAKHEFAVQSADVLRYAAQSQCSAYDCEFVVLADDLGVPLITTDKKVLREFPRTAMSVTDYLQNS
jgi:predicted nucleic acid-binding protein